MNNDKLLLCYSNSITFAVVSNFLSTSYGTVATANLALNAVGCKFTFTDDVAIIDSGNAFTFSTTPSLVTTCKSKINNSPNFIDIAVRNG